MLKMHGRSSIHHSIRGLAAALLFIAFAGASTVSAQSVDAVVNEMRARYQAQLETVDTYIVETNQYTSYHRKTTRDGDATYETEMQWKDSGGGMFSGAGAMPSLQPGLAQLDTLAQKASYLGTETVDGRPCHVLRIDDPAALSGNRMPAMNANAPQQGETRLYIDAEQYVPLRLESEVSVERNGESQTLRPRILLSDYRTTDGLTLPWSMEMKMENLDATISAEERKQARQSLEEMEQRMQEMPEEQRQMMEGMMKNQLEQLRNILDEGSIQFAIEVQDVQVNAPLPDDVFSGGSN